MRWLCSTTLIPMLFSAILYGNTQSTDRYESFLDGAIQTKLKDKSIAGATLCLVTGDRVLMSKGYGYSDFEGKVKVDEDYTLFRIGSISKLFVWHAVMQQVEKGNLDLDTDVNNYLVDFKIPETYPTPITLRHLMSHTPGLDDRIIGLFSYDPSKIAPLLSILSEEMPQRVAPPGLFASYSNHGSALAAHIVEIVSGKSWNDYVDDNIIAPLSMHSTSFRQPLPPDLQPRMSKGYTLSDGRLMEKPFEYVPLAPAGSVSSSATDMARFMQMLLNRGRLGDSVIIDTTSFATMLTPVLYHAPNANPCLPGFMDLSRMGVRIFGHGGDTFWFHSLVAVMPEHNLGLFLSFNSEGGNGAYNDILSSFVNQFLSPHNDSTETIKLGDDYLKLLAGEFRASRFPQNDYTKLLTLIMRIKISVADGMLRTQQGEQIDYWEPIDSLSFRQTNGPDMLIFTKGDGENVSYAFLSLFPVIRFERTNFFQSTTLHLSILIGTIILSLITLLHWPMVYMVRRRYHPMSIAKKEIPTTIKLTAWLAALLLLTFYLTFGAAVGSPEQAVFHPSTVGLRISLLIPFIVIILTLIMVINTPRVWVYRNVRFRSRVFYTLLTMMNLAALWQLFTMNLIGYYL